MSTLVAGNWKTNLTGTLASELAEEIGHRLGKGVAVFPPAVYAERVRVGLADSGVALGLQDVSEQSFGATTGDHAAEQLLDVGCTYALVGHSERRARHGETNESVAEKAKAASEAGLIPVVCCGEQLAERESDTQEAVVEGQLAEVISALSGREWVIAYEPVWAIGTGQTASAEQAQAMHAFIRRLLGEQDPAERTKILYGGSVNAANAAGFAACKDIDGALVGGASLKIDEFVAIAAAFQRKG